MSGEVIVACMSLLGTLIGSYSGMRLMSYRIEQLEKKVDKHNNFAEKIPLLEEKIKVLEKRLEAIEDEIKEVM